MEWRSLKKIILLLHGAIIAMHVAITVKRCNDSNTYKVVRFRSEDNMYLS